MLKMWKTIWKILKWIWGVMLKGEEVKAEAIRRMYGKKEGEDNDNRKTDL